MATRDSDTPPPRRLSSAQSYTSPRNASHQPQGSPFSTDGTMSSTPVPPKSDPPLQRTRTAGAVAMESSLRSDPSSAVDAGPKAAQPPRQRPTVMEAFREINQGYEHSPTPATAEPVRAEVKPSREPDAPPPGLDVAMLPDGRTHMADTGAAPVESVDPQDSVETVRATVVKPDDHSAGRATSSTLFGRRFDSVNTLTAQNSANPPRTLPSWSGFMSRHSSEMGPDTAAGSVKSGRSPEEDGSVMLLAANEAVNRSMPRGFSVECFTANGDLDEEAIRAALIASNMVKPGCLDELVLHLADVCETYGVSADEAHDGSPTSASE